MWFSINVGILLIDWIQPGNIDKNKVLTGAKLNKEKIVANTISSRNLKKSEFFVNSGWFLVLTKLFLGTSLK